MKQSVYSISSLVIAITCLLSLVFLSHCKSDNPPEKEPESYKDTAYTLTLFPGAIEPIANPNNPLTIHGVELGRKLFYEPMLSGDNSQSCASCHNQANSFSDAPNRFSKGIDGIEGPKNSMALINMAWNIDFFWDGRSKSLEEQALEPIRNPIEMHGNWKDAMAKLQAQSEYVELFKKAFGTKTIDSLLVARAITQFVKTIVVRGSKFQRGQLTQEESLGYGVFRSFDKGDCLHCHPIEGYLFTDNFINNPVQRFHNNGLDPEAPAGILTGRALITQGRADNGKFKTPTLLNIELTAPYMHDGRFETLEEVVDFYNEGVHMSSTLDPNMGVKGDAPNRRFEDGKRKLGLSDIEKKQLVAFLKALTDRSVTTNPAYSKP